METIISDQTFHFPEEILLEILIKLPPKSIFRFKCVSKHWLSLISHSSFLPFYISRSKNSLPFALVFQCHNRINSFVSTDNTFKILSSLFPSDQIPDLKIDATSNDLILYKSNSYDESVYFVANPFTNNFVKLPRHIKRRSVGPTGLISSVENGFTSYNVVRLTQFYDNIEQHLLNLETFSSIRGEWTNLKVKICTLGLEIGARPCIAFKGALHWICNRMTALLAYDNCGLCRFISVPNEAYHMSGKNAILGVCGGNLCYFEMSGISIQEGKLPGWKMWVLRDYEKGEWSVDREAKERKIESFGILWNVLSMHSPLFPVAFHPWDSDVVYFWYEGYVLSFSTKTGLFLDKFSMFCSESCNVLSTWEMFPLLMPFCSTRIDNVVAQVSDDAE